MGAYLEADSHSELWCGPPELLGDDVPIDHAGNPAVHCATCLEASGTSATTRRTSATTRITSATTRKDTSLRGRDGDAKDSHHDACLQLLEATLLRSVRGSSDRAAVWSRSGQPRTFQFDVSGDKTERRREFVRYINSCLTYHGAAGPRSFFTINYGALLQYGKTSQPRSLRPGVSALLDLAVRATKPESC